jgi:hypothetical protein
VQAVDTIEVMSKKKRGGPSETVRVPVNVALLIKQICDVSGKTEAQLLGPMLPVAKLEMMLTKAWQAAMEKLTRDMMDGGKGK